MKIIFTGAGEFGVPTLRALSRAHEVSLAITQPDRPAGRRRAPRATPIGSEAGALGIETVKTGKANEAAVVERVASEGADAMVVVAFGQFLSQALVNTPRLGSLNLHASLLPRWRGASPINAAILAGDPETGNSTMRLVKEMDAGAILGQQSLPIDPRETAGELHDRLAALGVDLVLNTLEGLAAGRIAAMEQDEGEATFAPKLSKADGWVDFGADAKSVRCRVHGLTPWPGAAVTWTPSGRASEPHRLLLRRVEESPDFAHDEAPGALLTGAGLVACGSGAIRVLEVQPAGKKAMDWGAFANGHNPTPGERFVSEQPPPTEGGALAG